MVGCPGWRLAAGKPCCAGFKGVRAALGSRALPVPGCSNAAFPWGLTASQLVPGCASLCVTGIAGNKPWVLPWIELRLAFL